MQNFESKVESILIKENLSNEQNVQNILPFYYNIAYTNLLQLSLLNSNNNNSAQNQNLLPTINNLNNFNEYQNNLQNNQNIQNLEKNQNNNLLNQKRLNIEPIENMPQPQPKSKISLFQHIL